MEVVRRWRDMGRKRAGVWACSGKLVWSYWGSETFSSNPKCTDYSEAVASMTCNGKGEVGVASVQFMVQAK